jgi:hypothetical protein
MKQRTVAMMTGFEQYTKKTGRAQFREEMEPHRADNRFSIRRGT